MLRKPAYQDNGRNAEPPSGLINGTALGCTAKERIRIVLKHYGFQPQAGALTVKGMKLSNVLNSVLKNDDSGHSEEALRMLASDGRWHVRAELAAHLPKYSRDF